MQDYPIFARKMSEFYVIIARKNICSRILGVRAPVSYAYVDRQYKRHYAAQKRITRQAKVKQTSGLQTVKMHIKSFFAFYTCFRTSISHFHTSHFIRALQQVHSHNAHTSNSIDTKIRVVITVINLHVFAKA